jgi:hypothetical protein
MHIIFFAKVAGPHADVPAHMAMHGISLNMHTYLVTYLTAQMQKLRTTTVATTAGATPVPP